MSHESTGAGLPRFGKLALAGALLCAAACLPFPGCDGGTSTGADNPGMSGDYTSSLAPPYAAPQGPYTFTDSVAVSLTAESGAAIYYSLDGSAPSPSSASSARYTHPVLLRSSATLIAAAYLKGWTTSLVSVNNYVLVPAPPAAAPAGQRFQDSLRVTLSAPAKTASIYYSLDGSVPSSATGAKYDQPLLIKATATLRAVAVVPGLGESRELEEEYILVTDSLATAP